MMMKNNVYGLIGIKAVNANWNADFSGKPKRLPNGRYFGSDKALKYAMRKFWELQGHNVLFMKKRVRTADDNIVDATLADRYAELFGNDLKSDNRAVILQNILRTVDARQFGFTFAGGKGKDISSVGPVQIGTGPNLCQTSMIFNNDLMSPFRNVSDTGKDAKKEKEDEKKKEKSKASITTEYLVDRADYAYPFSIMPANMGFGNDFRIEGDEYTDEDFDLFKRAAATCANSVTSCTKGGTYNEYLLIVEASDRRLYLKNFETMVTLEGDTLVLDRLMEYLSYFGDRIASVTLWYDDTCISTGDYEGLEKRKIYELQ